ncbi:MAG: PAS domain S-box protein [Pseudomonadales bacterium]
MTLPDSESLPFPGFVADAECRIRYVNRAWHALLGDRLGERWVDLFDEMDANAVLARWRACQRSLEPLRVRGRIVDRSGTTRYFAVHCQPFIETEDAPTELYGLLVDITDEVQQEAENIAILETAVDAVICIDERGRIETFNQAAMRLFGYAASEIIGQPITILMAEPHRSLHDDYIQRYLSTGDRRIIGIGRELEGVDRDGQRIPIYLAVSEIRMSGRHRFAGIIRDLREQRANREALAEQRERLAHGDRLSTMGEMTASIAHEINQPLTAISMYAQSGIRLIERGDADPVRLREALQKLIDQSLRAGAIIERIQRFARAQENQRELGDVNALLTDLLKLAETDARLHAMDLTLELQPDLPAVYCDPVQIQQVALNLIRNAIDAMNEIQCIHGREIRIRTRLLGDGRVEVSVSDQGPGVADDQQDLLFTPFHTTKKDGMGMGLSICRTIIAEHGGVLSFRNNDATGATFFFTLPQGTLDDEQS